jgi:hypothetical protein
MQANLFQNYTSEINGAYLRGDATEHTHRPALKKLIEALGDNITATNEPKRRTDCGAPDMLVSRRKRNLDFRVGYIECKDMGTNLKEEEKTEQIKKRYLPSLHNFILTNYIEFRWYTNGQLRLTGTLAREGEGGAFSATEAAISEVRELLRGFLEHGPEKVSGAKELAVRMGHMAQMLRDVTKRTFTQEQEEGTLHSQFEAFREVLIHDLTPEQFADMYAQTICYGLFTARCHIEDMTIFGPDKFAAFHGMNEKPQEFTRKDAAYLLPKTNPFLRKMFNHIAGPDLDDRIAWFVDDVVALLRQADMGVILRDFARRKGRRDPVVHFYETFLAEYDPKMRKKRGVYYTPDEVVSYIVRSVDWLLKEKFGLKRGLADESKIRLDSRLRGNDKEAAHKVLILDPAVGTGTFLFEVIDQVYGKFKRQKGMWSGYVREHLLPRLFGFELQMAPYAVAHMKLGLQLAETGYDFQSDERLGIYLTNTLEEAEEISKNVFVQWLSEEARAANQVKKDLPIMVVIGNPPYAGISANKGNWINSLLAPYREVDGEPLGERKVWVKNDYVKFIRFGQWRIEQTGQGVLGFITDHSYLDSPTFRGMRRNLMKCFDEIYLLNLHGNSKRKETSPDGGKDENVFDIIQGTAISLFVKSSVGGPTRVFYADLWGRRKPKYAFLAASNAKSIEWQQIEPKPPFYEFVPVDGDRKDEYEKGWKVTELFCLGSNGVQTSRDQLVVALDQEDLKDKINRFGDIRLSDNEVRDEFFSGKGNTKYRAGDTRGWKLGEARAELQKNRAWENDIVGYTYRPFDDRFLLYSAVMVDWPREDVMQHLRRDNLALCAGRAGLVVSAEWDLVFCVRQMCDHNLFYRGSSFNMPLYLYPNSWDKGQADMDYENWTRGKDGRMPNLSRGFVEDLAEQIKLKFVSDGHGDLKVTFGPEDLFDYIYGVLHSPEYRRRYAEFLRIDFPRIPLPKGKDIFRKVCKVGGQFVKLHLMEADILEDEKRCPSFPKEGSRVVERVYPKYVATADKPEKAKVYINKDQYFEGIRPEVWQFHIGAYQVCEKWLKNRRGRELSYDDVKHYQKIVVALGETIRLMNEHCLSEMFEKPTREGDLK